MFIILYFIISPLDIYTHDRPSLTRPATPNPCTAFDEFKAAVQTLSNPPHHYCHTLVNLAMHCTACMEKRLIQSQRRKNPLHLLARWQGWQAEYFSHSNLVYFLICQFYFLPSLSAEVACSPPELRHYCDTGFYVPSATGLLAWLIISISCNQHPS